MLSGSFRGGNGQAPPEDGTIAVSDAKRKIYAKRLVLISALLLIVFGIVAMYLGAANLMRYVFWSSTYEGEFTQGGMWTESNVGSYLAFGLFFTITGILGVLGGLWLFFKGVLAVVSDDKATLRKWLLVWAIIGLIPSPGIIFVGILLLFVEEASPGIMVLAENKGPLILLDDDVETIGACRQGIAVYVRIMTQGNRGVFIGSGAPRYGFAVAKGIGSQAVRDQLPPDFSAPHAGPAVCDFDFRETHSLKNFRLWADPKIGYI